MRSFGISRSRQRLLCGISMISLIGSALSPTVLLADEGVARRVLVGANGRNAKANLIDSNVVATAGAAGGDIVLTNTYAPSSAVTAGPAVELGSTGGKGGDGDATLWASEPGARGAAGGTVDVVQNGALTGAGNQTTPAALLLVYSVGGKGGFAQQGAGGGGAGGDVTLRVNRSVIAQGDGFAGVRAYSSGGASGGGGNTEDRALANPAGAAGAVKVTIGDNATISTRGMGAPAVVVESTGGNGGTRGSGTFYSDPYVTQGGAGGAVTFNNRGVITTEGASSPAVLLQSVGGRGGDQPDAGGRPGGTGGVAGAVIANQLNSITTSGAYGVGLLAQSVGGSGGNGGAGIFGGGDGGAAAAGGTATVNNYGTIATGGVGASAIVAQSVGGGNAANAFQLKAITPGSASGGGGTGGNTFFGSGGAGGTGGDGGAVFVSNGGSLQTRGDGAFGILAQSIGGGGGAGGAARSVGLFASVALGGDGGGGGNGGTVTIARDGQALDAAYNPFTVPSITTSGKGAGGVAALSVGGSGGVGGQASATSIGVVGSISVAVGGNGGKGGNGGTVAVTNTSLITTTGLQAVGLQAKSIGGGGGNAGSASAYAVAVAPPTLPAVSVTFSLGGKGGDGGAGGQVTVNNLMNITTRGGTSAGIQAMSVGGGGGDAGTASSVSDMISLYANIGGSVGIGGAGGGGGSGQKVSVTNAANVETSGSYSNAITGMSIGGGGGDGGAGSAAAAVGLSWSDKLNTIVSGALPTADSFSLNYDIGGKGGKGGAGGVVEVTNTGGLLTSGVNSRGIFAQSIGGGGGNGGGYLSSGSGTLTGKVNIGGWGGDGGAGGNVTVTNARNAFITTTSAGAYGILAQSVGGGGGTGGTLEGSKKSAINSQPAVEKLILQTADELVKLNKVASFFLGDTEKKALADYEFLDKKGPMQKQIAAAGNTIKALKVFGDKNKSFFTALREAGVTLLVGRVLDEFKYQIKQAYKTELEGSTKLPSLDLNMTAGGLGGAGGSGGVVTVTNAGTVATEGDNSYAIVAQSLGGGGGLGGAGSSTGTNKLNVNLTLGGTGGVAGQGGAVTVTNSGMVTTRGASAFGLLAQSVGGGGGVGGAAASANTISLSVNAGLGGSSSQSGAGGTVTVTNSGTIATSGKQAHAIVAQSVGGGGGVVFVGRVDPYDSGVLSSNAEEKEALDAIKGLAAALGITNAGSFGDTTANILPSPTVTLGVGGSGSGGGNGGAVNVTHSGSVETGGLAAFGIFAQSIGGGGGMGADSSANGTNTVTAALGGTGGVAGKGGAIAITFDGSASIMTGGDGSHGVFAQSIGGGGGYAGVGVFQSQLPNGLPITTGLVRDEVASGDGGTITIKTAETSKSLSIATAGNAAHGIFAQSIGGGGGSYTNVTEAAVATPLIPSATAVTRTRASGNGSNVVIDITGNVATTGLGSYGIYSQTGMQKTDGSIDLSKRSGTTSITFGGYLLGGAGDGGAIRVDGGLSNTITLKSGALVEALSGKAIVSSAAYTSLTNNGTLVGDVSFTNASGPKVSTFENNGTYRSTSAGALRLSGAVFTNAGAFDIAGVGTIGTATIWAGTTHLNGQLLADVTSTPASGQARSDVLTVYGNASVQTNVVANVVGGLLPESFTVATFSGGGQTGSATGSGNVFAPFTWNANLVGNGLQVTPQANFYTPPNVTASTTERAVQSYLQSAFNSNIGRPDAITQDGAAIFGAFARSSSYADYWEGIDSLAPEETLSVAASQTLNTRTSLHAALSCPVFEGSGVMMEETSCAWARLYGDWVRQAGSADTGGYSQNSITYRVGAQHELNEGWFLGATAGFTQSNLSSTDGFSTSEGNAFDASLALKRQIGPWLFAVTGNFGYGNYDTRRTLSIGDDVSFATGSANVWTAGLRFRGSYEFAFDGWYMKPYADMDVLYTNMPGHTESGSGLADMRFASAQQWNAAVSPNVEFGGRLKVNEQMWLRPYATIGATFFAEDNMQVGVQIADSGFGNASYTADLTIPSALLNISLGAQLYKLNGFEVRAEYKVDVGDTYTAQQASARLAVPF